MTKDEIMFLTSAGFSLSEIMAMNTDQVSVTGSHDIPSASDPEPAQEPEHEFGEHVPESVQEVKADPVPDFNQTFQSMMDDMKKMFETQLNTLQAANIRNAVQQAEKETTPEDLIANIINPKPRKRGD